MTALDATQGLHRFGLGPRIGDAARFGGHIREAVIADLDGKADPLLTAATLRDSSEAYALYNEQRLRKRAARKLAAATPAPQAEVKADDQSAGGDMKSADGDMKGGNNAKRAGLPRSSAVVRPLLQDEVAARLDRVKAAEVGFVERLVAFWTNHFAVSAKANGQVRVLAGAYEREAIRPHVLGRFEDMLMAATRHAAMLIYLDNARSIGPDSPAGKSRNRGLNENHARELMELHTLGVDGGYSQADVTAFARALTGWTVATHESDPDRIARFVFRAQWHEPGAQTILGKQYDQEGEAQGEAVLRDLARHPATARHIARKLAQAFVADAPPPALVTELQDSFRKSGGDLRELARTLVRSDDAWRGPPTKFKSPQEFLWSAMRGLDVDMPVRFAIQALRNLGQEPWFVPSPAGFPASNDAWLAPDALTNRLHLAEYMASRSRTDIDIPALTRELLGPSVPIETTDALSRAESRKQALALLLMSPDFQRR